MTSITIPPSVTSIEPQAFSGCSGLTAINVSSDNPEYSSADGILYDKDQTCLYVCPVGKVGAVSILSSVTSINKFAFRNCRGLTSITIPSSVTSIGTSVFYFYDECSGLKAIYSFNPVPPECFGDAFDSRYEYTTLYVPFEALEAYKTTDPWSKFQNIQGFDATGIDDMEADGNGMPEMYYDLNSRKSATPHHGVNIVRFPNGTARKVIMK